MKFLFLTLAFSLTAMASDSKVAKYTFEDINVKTTCMVYETSPGNLHFDFTVKYSEREFKGEWNTEDFFGLVELKDKVLKYPYSVEENSTVEYQTLFSAFNKNGEKPVWGNGKKTITSSSPDAVEFVQMMGTICTRFTGSK